MQRRKIFFDTESIGFYGPTVTIQYCIDDGKPVLWNIWDHSVQDTLDLIEMHLENEMYGFNLVHDAFHYFRTYNVLSNLPRLHVPEPLDYYDVERESLDRYCLRPYKACDLLLVGRRTKLQATMNQKKITMRKVPRVLAEFLSTTLKETIEIPSIYFSKKSRGYEWKIVPLIKGTGNEATQIGDEIDENFVNLKLEFAPSSSLKHVMQFLGHEVEHFSELNFPKVKEYSWFPTQGDWIDVIRDHLHIWRNDPRAVQYALNDPVYTREMYKYLDCPEAGDIESELTFNVGGAHWRGYTIDRRRCERRLKRLHLLNKAPINVNSPRQVKVWLGESADAYEKQLLTDTRAETLKKIAEEWREENPSLALRAKTVLRAKRANVEITLVNRLLEAGRLHAVCKLSGTKSNRMSGGSESYIKTNGSLNIQGIKKGPGIRSLFLLANPELNEELNGGDFSGFEVSIADAVYGDPTLHSELLSGKKMHALFGAEMYGMSYDDILATADYNINDPMGFYQRAKRGFFASLYGAEEDKLAQSMWLTKEEAAAGLLRFFQKYTVIQAKRLQTKIKFTALTQKEMGGKIIWQEPDQYIESFLGFRRYFNLEISIIRNLYNLAQDPPPLLKELGSKIKVVRRDRIQSASGASMSAMYSVCFSLQNQMFRAAANHEMQSPGGELTKRLQYEIWSFQPVGVHKWYVMPLNMHDELETPTDKEISHLVKQRVKETVLSFRQYVPLIKMDFGTIKHWGKK